MALHAVIYRYADDAAALDEHRPRHRDHLRKLNEAGHLLVSGPLAEGGGPGALLIFRAESAAQVAQWLDSDPFKVLGLIVDARSEPGTRPSAPTGWPDRLTHRRDRRRGVVAARVGRTRRGTGHRVRRRLRARVRLARLPAHSDDQPLRVAMKRSPPR